MRRPYRTYGINRMGRRNSYRPMCQTHPDIPMRYGTCPRCSEIREEARQAAIAAQPDVKHYSNWEKKAKIWSPSYSPLYMILLDKEPVYTDEKGNKHHFGFGSASLCGSHGRTVEEVRGYVKDMLAKFPQFPWVDITIKIVNAPCVWDASIIHEVIETVEVK